MWGFNGGLFPHTPRRETPHALRLWRGGGSLAFDPTEARLSSLGISVIFERRVRAFGCPEECVLNLRLRGFDVQGPFEIGHKFGDGVVTARLFGDALAVSKELEHRAD